MQKEEVKKWLVRCRVAWGTRNCEASTHPWPVLPLSPCSCSGGGMCNPLTKGASLFHRLPASSKLKGKRQTVSLSSWAPGCPPVCICPCSPQLQGQFSSLPARPTRPRFSGLPEVSPYCLWVLAPCHLQKFCFSDRKLTDTESYTCVSPHLSWRSFFCREHNPLKSGLL